jgi:23S rRNA pseudouridine1911/1915/1917 synthase
VSVLAGVSRAAARLLLEQGEAVVDDETVRPADRLPAGAVVEVRLPDPEPPLAPEPVAFTVVHEDRDLAVIDKPAGVVVHPGAGRQAGTLAAGVLHRWPQVRGVGDEDRWGIVHRLDKDTSGLLVVALTHEAFAGLRTAMRERAIDRRYLALVQGIPDGRTGTIDAPIERDGRRPGRFRVGPEGRPSRTHYRRVATWDRDGYCLLEIRLETGRTHQIRVHSASIGHPIAGDSTYGRGGRGWERLWLHSGHLALRHPITASPLAASSAVPDELVGALERIGDPDEGALPPQVAGEWDPA